MKLSRLLIAAGLLFGLASCSKDEVAEPGPVPADTRISSGIQVQRWYTIHALKKGGVELEDMHGMPVVMSPSGEITLMQSRISSGSVIDKGRWSLNSTGNLLTITMSGTSDLGLLLQAQPWTVISRSNDQLVLKVISDQDTRELTLQVVKIRKVVI
jgi:hypothetical protein